MWFFLSKAGGKNIMYFCRTKERFYFSIELKFLSCQYVHVMSCSCIHIKSSSRNITHYYKSSNLCHICSDNAHRKLHSWQCSPAHNQHKGQTPKRFQGKRKKKEVQSIILAISSKTHHLQSSSAFARHQEDKTLK